MANPGTSSAQGNELENAGTFDASGNKIWINRATNDYIQMNSGELDIYIAGVKTYSFQAAGTGFTAIGARVTVGGTFSSNGPATNINNPLLLEDDIPSGVGPTFTPVTQTSAALTSGAAFNFPTQIPAGSFILGLHGRVQTTITGAVSLSVGYTGTVTAFGSALALTAGTTFGYSTWTATAMPFFSSATNIVLTANGSNFTAGVVKVCYVLITTPASTA